MGGEFDKVWDENMVHKHEGRSCRDSAFAPSDVVKVKVLVAFG